GARTVLVRVCEEVAECVLVELVAHPEAHTVSRRAEALQVVPGTSGQRRGSTHMACMKRALSRRGRRFLSGLVLKTPKKEEGAASGGTSFVYDEASRLVVGPETARRRCWYLKRMRREEGEGKHKRSANGSKETVRAMGAVRGSE